MKLCNARIFDGTTFVTQTAVSFENGIITALDNDLDGMDVHGKLLAPGFVDIHMHGIQGLDCMRMGDLQEMVNVLVQYGTTSFCPASLTETDKAIRSYLCYVHEAMSLQNGARVLGAYLEGPYLAESVKGAHDAEKLKDPIFEHYKKLVSSYETDIRRITLAPERKGGMELSKLLSDQGIAVSIGHSAATAKQTLKAAHLGVNSSTHTCNGMNPLHHRKPGVLGAVLTENRIKAEFIADLIHIDPILIQLIYQSKGSANCFYCTDSMEATGMPDGTYRLGMDEVTVKDGIAKKDGSLAGSTLTMDKGLRNLVHKVGLPLCDALRMATRNPAEVIKISDIGQIKVGAKADFVLLDNDLHVTATYVRGKLEYKKSNNTNT